MKHHTTLDRLEPGQRATVITLSAPEAQSRRLMELGFIPGGAVAALFVAPWGDPVAYDVCGAVVALRRADARQVAVSL